MLRQNPFGGRPLNRFDSVDFDDGGLKWKIGYCDCGAKILVDREEITGLVETFGHLLEGLQNRKSLREKVGEWLLSGDKEKIERNGFREQKTIVFPDGRFMRV